MLRPWISRWWEIANERRGLLIHRKHMTGPLTDDQERELTMLQKVAEAVLEMESGNIKSTES